MAFKDTTERNAMNYYISDLHIGHENILRFDNRPFADVNEMNNKLIGNWNARVRSDDTVYILGDFIWAKESEWPSIVGSLGGNKVLIRGNHDPKQFSAATKRMFQEITDLKEIKDSGKHVVMCHYPIPFFRASFASTAFICSLQTIWINGLRLSEQGSSPQHSARIKEWSKARLARISAKRS